VLERISGVNVSLADARTALDSFGFIDTFLGGNDVVIGTDNTEFATDVAFEVFFTGAGNDIVFGHGGLDVYIDGPGSDLYVGGRTSSNIDVVYDVIDYGNSPYAIRVSLAGGVGSFGSQVTFVGSADVDTLVNFDQVYGTSGNDIFTIDSSFVNKQGDGRAWIGGLGGNDEINGNGQTLIDLADAADAVYVNFALGVARSLNGAPNEDRAGIGVDSFTGVRAVHGSIFDDVLLARMARNPRNSWAARAAISSTAAEAHMTGSTFTRHPSPVLKILSTFPALSASYGARTSMFLLTTRSSTSRRSLQPSSTTTSR
jgi:hypothetical protein